MSDVMNEATTFHGLFMPKLYVFCDVTIMTTFSIKLHFWGPPR